MDENVADPLTKPLPQPKHECHARAIGLKQMLEWLSGPAKALCRVSNCTGPPKYKGPIIKVVCKKKKKKF